MDINKVKRAPRHHQQSEHITIRITPAIKDWLKKNHLSPTKIFHEAIRELGYQKR